MTAEQLRNSILQMAVSGKLVTQDPKDEPASVLLDRVHREKQQLVNEGKIRREKNPSLIFRGADNTFFESNGKKEPICIENELPFDIPNSWTWARLGSIVYNHGQKKPDSDFCYIDIGSIDNENQKLNESECILSATEAPSRARKIVDIGDILYSTVRPYLHNMCIIDRKFSHTPIASTGFAVMTCCTGVINQYLFYYLLSPFFDAYANDAENSKGVAYPAINDTRLYHALIPIPPEQEQQRIVHSIRLLLPHVSKYKTAEVELDQLNTDFPDKIRKSILHIAIQGKLVSQDPNDEPVSVLMERINKVKEQLVKAGKIKREKSLPDITEDEVPFEIPENWKWCRLSSLGVTQTGNTPSKTRPELFGSYIPFIGPGDIQNNTIRYDNQGLSELGREFGRIVDAGSILQVCIGGSIGKCAITNQIIAFNQQINAITPILVCNEYLLYVLSSGYFTSYIKEHAGGTATPIVNRGMWDAIAIPVPPLPEQKRIVAKLKEIIPLYERLKP